MKIGNPLDESNHVGPIIDTLAVDMYNDTIGKIAEEGGKTVLAGEELTGEGYESGCDVKRAIYEVENHYQIVQHETFAPIFYLIKYSDLGEAIATKNDVPQGLS